MASASATPSPLPVYTPFAGLSAAGDVSIKVLVCRSWDVKNPAGKYIGTEFIFSDDSGNGVHCIARSAIAHCVVPKLKVGEVFCIRRFSVAANKTSYRVRRDDTYLINLESNTLIQKLDCSSEGFTRQPVTLQSLEEISFNKHEFLIDVIGRPINVGCCKPTRNCSTFVDFELMNERGRIIKVTLWGALGDELVRTAGNPNDLSVVLLPAMNIREYRGDLQLSSTAGTILFYGDDIPEIAAMRKLFREYNSQIKHNYGTLLQLLTVGRGAVGVSNAPTVTVVCKVTIAGIRPKTPWNYYSCGEKGCKKGVTPSGGQFWCESCEKICEFPIVRFLLRLEVSDDSTPMAVTLFDEIAESLVMKSAAVLMGELEGREEELEYPDEISSLIGTTHELELKSHTYYNHGPYESFTVTRVLKPQPPQNVIHISSPAQESPPLTSDHVTTPGAPLVSGSGASTVDTATMTNVET